MFSAEQKTALAAPLNRANVKQRTQSGRSMSYVEGWHAIAEANRIFGFDGWSRETVDLKCVSEREREIGAQKLPGFGVTYIARVRIKVGYMLDEGIIVREGCGTGHGIDRDLGQAHESALKEAETDAMKRALMTFGNPFGLALYDKEQTNVASEGDMAKAAPAKPPAVGAAQISNRALDMMTMIDGCDTVRALDNYAETTLKTAITKLSTTDADLVRTRFGQRKAALKSAEHLAA